MRTGNFTHIIELINVYLWEGLLAMCFFIRKAQGRYIYYLISHTSSVESRGEMRWLNEVSMSDYCFIKFCFWRFNFIVNPIRNVNVYWEPSSYLKNTYTSLFRRLSNWGLCGRQASSYCKLQFANVLLVCLDQTYINVKWMLHVNVQVKGVSKWFV